MIEEMPDWMAEDQRLQKKHGWRVVYIPKTVEELKAEIKPFEDQPETEQAEVKRRGRKPKSE